jgi:hypothetical protein
MEKTKVAYRPRVVVVVVMRVMVVMVANGLFLCDFSEIGIL